jgi:Protein of unknown function (DUF982)
MHTPWKKPVVVSLGEPPVETTIETTQAAAWAMIEDWPMEDGTALDRALEICAAVDAGKRKPEDARNAFVQAATEAAILIRG